MSLSILLEVFLHAASVRFRYQRPNFLPLSEARLLHAMPGYHQYVVVVQRFFYQLSNGNRGYGPRGSALVYRRQGLTFTMMGAGCYAFCSTPAHDWRVSLVYESDHHWGCVPFGHRRYSGGYPLCDSEALCDVYTFFHGSPLSTCPPEQLHPIAFVERFIAPMSNGLYREAYIMANYSGKVDVYVRMGSDTPADAYEQLQADLDDPNLWWIMRSEPIVTGVTSIFLRES